MTTITEDYVSFEIAKLLKEKGFDEKCKTYYKVFPEDRIAAIYHSSENRGVSEDDPNEILCPTLQMAMKWLREVHKLAITVSIGNENNKGNTDYSNPDRWFYFFDITNEKGVVIDTEYDPLSNEFPTYEEACETAIKYCLEHLI